MKTLEFPHFSCYLVDNKLSNSQTAPFRKVKGYNLKKINDYIEKYKEVKDYNYAVNIVNYPFIVSSNGDTKEKYDITNPDDLLTLVKKGFYLNDYEPKDLVNVDSEYVAPTCDHPQLRKVAANALIKMIKDAEKEDMHLLLNSGYRSYEEQTKIYDETQQKYGEVYAKEYVATPGASEHQTGLGIDMTSQSVVDKQRLVFGDTVDINGSLKTVQNMVSSFVLLKEQMVLLVFLMNLGIYVMLVKMWLKKL